MQKTVSLKSPSLCLSLAVAIQLASCGGGSDQTPSSTPSQTSTPSQATVVQSSTQTSNASTASSNNTQATASGNALDQALVCGLPNFQDEILARVNQARASSRMCGSTAYQAAPALSWNSNLFNAAAGHSFDMATTNFFSHTSLDGRDFGQRISAAGYTWHAIAENIAGGQSTIAEVMTTWLDSPAHCANIMSGSYSEIGVACVASASSTYQRYWTMDLGHP